MTGLGMNERKTVLMAATYGGDLPITALVMDKIRDADKKQVIKLCQKKFFNFLPFLLADSY